MIENIVIGIIFGVLTSVIIAYVVPRILYIRKYKLKVYVFNFDTRGLTYSMIGRTTDIITPDDKMLMIKKSPFTKKSFFKFEQKAWDVMIELYLKTKRNICLFGSTKNPETGKEERDIMQTDGIITKKFFPTLTRENARIIMESKELLTTLNNLVKPKLAEELTKLKQVGKSTLDLSIELSKAKDEFVRSMKSMGHGIKDASQIICEVFGLKPQEINVERIQEMLAQKKQAEEKHDDGEEKR